MNQFTNYLAKQKVAINNQINSFLNGYQTELTKIGHFGQDLLIKFQDFTQRGKSLRGVLTILTAEMFGVKEKNLALKAGAALEIIHSALLIHDDIMDNDFLRRGQPTLFAQYTNFAQKNHFRNPLNFGRSLAIAAGDIGLYLGLKILQDQKTENQPAKKISQKIIQEIINVGIAQMDDVYFGYLNQTPTLTDIERMYKYKTSRYTFSLPFAIGALMAQKNQQLLTKMEKLGEYLGLIYQIKDDEIGLFSSQQKTGKPVGSDIRENKKTYLRTLCFTQADGSNLKKLQKIYQKKEITKEDLTNFKKLYQKLKIKKKINQVMNRCQKKAWQIIKTLPIDKKYQRLLKDLISFLKEREN